MRYILKQNCVHTKYTKRNSVVIAAHHKLSRDRGHIWVHLGILLVEIHALYALRYAADDLIGDGVKAFGQFV